MSYHWSLPRATGCSQLPVPTAFPDVKPEHHKSTEESVCLDVLGQQQMGIKMEALLPFASEVCVRASGFLQLF